MLDGSRPVRIPSVETARLILRALEPGDAPSLLENFRDPVSSRFWFTSDATLAEAEARVAKVNKAWNDHGFGDWAVVEKASGRFMGFCGLHFISWMDEVNLGYLLNQAFWGRGYGTEACLAAVRFGFEAAGLKQIVGVTHPENAASIKVLKKCGMVFWKNIVRAGVPRVVYSVERAR